MSDETTTPITPSSTDTKPGWQTTEFWKSMLVTAAGLVIAIIGVVQKDMTILSIGLGAAGLSTGAYSISRGLAKG